MRNDHEAPINGVKANDRVTNDTVQHGRSPVCADTDKATTDALSAGDVSRIIEMAWADEIPFDSIALQYGLNESAVIALMRREMKPSSFRMWRKRVTGRSTKHSARRLR